MAERFGGNDFLQGRIALRLIKARAAVDDRPAVIDVHLSAEAIKLNLMHPLFAGSRNLTRVGNIGGRKGVLRNTGAT
jgi:hypothetical protein